MHSQQLESRKAAEQQQEERRQADEQAELREAQQAEQEVLQHQVRALAADHGLAATVVLPCANVHIDLEH